MPLSDISDKIKTKNKNVLRMPMLDVSVKRIKCFDSFAKQGFF